VNHAVSRHFETSFSATNRDAASCPKTSVGVLTWRLRTA
jgi:hypothetical protein